MKKEDLFNAVGDVDNKYINEANMPKKKIKIWKILTPVAACLCCGVIGGTLILSGGLNGIKSESDGAVTSPNISNETIPQATETGNNGEIELVPKWDEMTPGEKYGSMITDGIEYNSANHTLSDKDRGNFIAKAAASGYDIYTDKTINVSCDIYEIKGIDPECAVAAEYDGEEGIYIYVNSHYMPKNLGEFTQKLSLSDNINFNAGYKEYTDEDDIFIQVKYTGLDTDEIYKIIFSDGNAEAVDYDSVDQINSISLSADVKLIGCVNMGVTVTDEGYIVTNLLDTGKAFYIGAEAAAEFMDYMKTMCEAESQTYPQSYNDTVSGTPEEEIVTQARPAENEIVNE